VAEEDRQEISGDEAEAMTDSVLSGKTREEYELRKTPGGGKALT